MTCSTSSLFLGPGRSCPLTVFFSTAPDVAYRSCSAFRAAPPAVIALRALPRARARLAAGHATFQASPRGRRLHASAQARYRARLKQKVTDTTSTPPSPSTTSTPTLPLIPSASVRPLEGLVHAPLSPTTADIVSSCIAAPAPLRPECCARCGRSLSGFLHSAAQRQARRALAHSFSFRQARPSFHLPPD
mgnify:CR=1 FL=1